MVPLELQAGHPASRYRLSLAQCPSLASSRFALKTSITRRTDILDRHTLAEATQAKERQRLGGLMEFGSTASLRLQGTGHRQADYLSTFPSHY